MKQDAFERAHRPEWSAFERWLELRARPGRKARNQDAAAAPPDQQFAARYRRICQHFALAEQRIYSATLQARLHDLVARGHQVLYRPPPPRLRRIVAFFASEFPRLVRAEWRAMTVSALLFFLPLALMLGLLQWQPELVLTVFEPSQIADFERMYDPASAGDRLGRDSGSDIKMFGYYIFNNVSIGFRTFASGLLFGLGSVVVLLSNGVMIGTVAGHLTAIGYGGPFWRFVVGHSAPELLAIVIAGGAGLHIGYALLAPGRRSRSRALLESGAVGARLVLGVFAMLVFAAFVEAFWSSLGWLPDALRFGAGGALWLLIGLWLWRGGRGSVDAA
ncbi:MAG: stage II sporulation protein M [Lysobacterales bacterium]